MSPPSVDDLRCKALSGMGRVLGTVGELHEALELLRQNDPSLHPKVEQKLENAANEAYAVLMHLGFKWDGGGVVRG